jgi:putative chitinase
MIQFLISLLLSLFNKSRINNIPTAPINVPLEVPVIPEHIPVPTVPEVLVEPAPLPVAPKETPKAPKPFAFTAAQLKTILPANKNTAQLKVALDKILPLYDINTKQRVACFLSQCGHESAHFTVLKENLNYSPDRLTVVFKKYFPTIAAAKKYANNPEKIANKVYANRMNNGNESSGDGWKYHGRGAIQITGKENYSLFARHINKTLEETVAYCETFEGAIESAAWFWKFRNLNIECDSNNFVSLTKKINGGTNGLAERQALYDKAIKTLKD